MTVEGGRFLDLAKWQATERQTARLILDAVKRLKKERGFTTSELCDRLEAAGWPTTVNSLNGMLGSKGRATITVNEVLAFADALQASITELLFPVGETVELRPDRRLRSPDAMLVALHAFLMIGGVKVFAVSRAEHLFKIMRTAYSIENALSYAIYHTRRAGAEDAHSVMHIQRLERVVLELNEELEQYRRTWDEEPPLIDDTAAWAIGASGTDLTPEFILAMERVFIGKGMSIGDYRLGGAGG